MNIPYFSAKSILALFFCCSYINQTCAQAPNTAQTLYAEIAHMDSVLFDAYNSQDIAQLRTLFTEDLEFFHDTGGLNDYEGTISAFKGIFSQDFVITRTLVPESMEVYPIKDYGAVQTGLHQFCHPENGIIDCGSFKFVHVWQKEGGQWRVARIVSYDH